MADCLFCKIAANEIPSKLVYEDEKAVAFEDINPEAPTHILVIPRKHISTIMDIAEDDHELIGHLYSVVRKIAKKLDLDEKGFRTVFNCGKDGGQTVFHVHIHILGGRLMTWPPG